MKLSIIITGAAGHLGTTLTEKLLEKGYRIHALISPRNDKDFLVHNELSIYQIDLLDSDACDSLIQKLLIENQVIALLCLVGAYSIGGIIETPLSSIQKMIDINFKTMYNVVRPSIAYNEIKNEFFQIIMIGSRPAIKANDGKKLVAYSLSKSLLFKMAEFINADSHKLKAKVSVIVPSTIDTSATRKEMANKDYSEWITPNDVAETINFILSDTGLKMRQPIYKLYNLA